MKMIKNLKTSIQKLNGLHQNFLNFKKSKKEP